ncbi:MAG: 30S ribosomal protein S3 [Chloroflexi bacterium]|nr:30S ribosomal protein S3 [Chloroflexota bacterium]
MGQKVHPIGFRLGYIRNWDARWYAERKSDFRALLKEDLALRRYIHGRLADAGVPRVEIERSANHITVTIHTAKPGIVIGKQGAKVEDLRQQLERLSAKRVRVNINEVQRPELDAYLVARSIADQLVRRVSFRRAIKQAVQRSIQRGAKGVKVVIAGRLGGSEMSRREREVQGKVPLHTLRADIDFGIAEAETTYGQIGVKVWVYRGDVTVPRRRRVVAVPVEEPPAEAPAAVEAAEGAEVAGAEPSTEGGAASAMGGE